MTIEQISESKLKITLFFSEFNAYELNTSDIDTNSLKLKKFIVSAIRKAARETGFEAAGSNIMVESVSKNDCLELFITRFNSSGHEVPIKKQLNHPTLKLRSSKIPIAKNLYAFFIFVNKGSFMEFFSSVKKEDFSSSSLYTMEDKYYFKTPVSGRLYIQALEFANPVCSQLLTLRLLKDGSFICNGEGFFKLI